MARKPKLNGKPYTSEGLAIINPYGGIWTSHIFDTREDALTHLRKFWGTITFDESGWHVASASLTITVKTDAVMTSIAAPRPIKPKKKTGGSR